MFKLGSLLEYLDRLALCGIFATHLHELLNMNLKLKSTKNKKMDFIVDEFGESVTCFQSHTSGYSYRYINSNIIKIFSYINNFDTFICINEYTCIEGDIKWTYKLSDGVCKDSMALVTAKQYGIHPDIIARAEELKKQLRSQNEKVAGILIDFSDGLIRSISSSTTVDHSGSDGSSSSSGDSRNVVRYDLEGDILPVIRSFMPDFNPVVVEVNYNPPVSYEGHNCVYVLLLSNTDNEV